MNISIEYQQKYKQPKIQFSEDFRYLKREKESKCEVTNHESHNYERKSDKSEVLAISQKALSSEKGVIDSCEIISEISTLVVDSVIEGSKIFAEDRYYALVTDNTPLLSLYLVELIED